MDRFFTRSPMVAPDVSSRSESWRNLRGSGARESRTGDVDAKEQSLQHSCIFRPDPSLQPPPSPTNSSTDLSIIEFEGPADAERSTTNERVSRRGARVLRSVTPRRSQSERNLPGQPSSATPQLPRRRLSRSDGQFAEGKVPDRKYRLSDRHNHSAPTVISLTEEPEPLPTAGPSEARERRRPPVRKHRSSSQLAARKNSTCVGNAAARRATVPSAEERQRHQKTQNPVKAVANPKRLEKQTSLPCTIRERSRVNVDIVDDGCAWNQSLARRPSLPREISSASSLRSYLDKLSAMKQTMESDKSTDSSGLDIDYSRSSLQRRSQHALASVTDAGLLPSSRHTLSPTLTETAESTEHTLSPFPPYVVQNNPALPPLDPSILSPPLAQTKSLSIVPVQQLKASRKHIDCEVTSSPDVTRVAPSTVTVLKGRVNASPCQEDSSVGSMASDIESLIQASPRNTVLELDGDSILSYSPTMKYSGDDVKVSSAVATHVTMVPLDNFQFFNEKSAHMSVPHMKTDADAEKNNAVCILSRDSKGNPTETGGAKVHVSLRENLSRRKCMNKSKSVPCLTNVKDSPIGYRIPQTEASRASGTNRRRPSEIRFPGLSAEKGVKAEIRTRRASDLGMSSRSSNSEVVTDETDQHQIPVKDSTPTMHRVSGGGSSGRSKSLSRRNHSDSVKDLNKKSSLKEERFRKRTNSEGRHHRGRSHRKQCDSARGSHRSPNDQRSVSQNADRKAGTRKSRSKSRGNQNGKKFQSESERRIVDKSLDCLALESLPGGSPNRISDSPINCLIRGDAIDEGNPVTAVWQSTQIASFVSELQEIKPISMYESTPQPGNSSSHLELAATTNERNLPSKPKSEVCHAASTYFGNIYQDPPTTSQAAPPTTIVSVYPAQPRTLSLNELVFSRSDESRQAPQRTLSDITDDPLFHKLTLAGISEEQVARMNLFGLKVTET